MVQHEVRRNHFDNDELYTNTGGKYCYEFKPRFI